MSVANPRVTSDGAIITNTTYVRYLCVSCDSMIETRDWPETSAPRCDKCARLEQVWTDKQLLANAIATDDGCDALCAAMLRLILYTANRVKDS